MRGPAFQLVDECTLEAFEFGSGIAARTTPLRAKGAVRHWPAWENWSFDKLAALCDSRVAEVVIRVPGH